MLREAVSVTPSLYGVFNTESAAVTILDCGHIEAVSKDFPIGFPVFCSFCYSQKLKKEVVDTFSS